jgi:hypothetical protein
VGNEAEEDIVVTRLIDRPTKGHIYEGETKDGLRHGHGVHTYANGDVFDGKFENDAAVYGKFQFLSTKLHRILNHGDLYEGEIENGTFNGKGTYHYKSEYHKYKGSRYEGQFKDGKRNGEGIYYYEDGSTQEGIFKDNWLTGHGKLTFPSGDIYEGFLFEGIPRGEGTYTWNNGEKYIGNYNNSGMRTGKGEYFFKGGTRRKGDFVNGHIGTEMVGQSEEYWHGRSQEHTIQENMILRMENIMLKQEITQIKEGVEHGTSRKLQTLLEHNEDTHLEFKASLWTCYITKNKVATKKVVINKKRGPNWKYPHLENEVLHTIAAFLNTEGGTLLIGVKDKPAEWGKKPAEVFGLENDYRIMGKNKDSDDYNRAILEILRNGFHMHPSAIDYVKIRTEQYEGYDICRVDVDSLPRIRDGAVWVKEKDEERNLLKNERYYVRVGSSSQLMSPQSAASHIGNNFPPRNAPSEGI